MSAHELADDVPLEHAWPLGADASVVVRVTGTMLQPPAFRPDMRRRRLRLAALVAGYIRRQEVGVSDGADWLPGALLLPRLSKLPSGGRL